MAPKITVIIATYYRNELVRDAIESVLNQDYEPIELIVVDDSGEGNAAPVIDDYDEVSGIIREENGDWEAAYETGVRAANGEYVQFLDDDDLLLEGKLTKTAEILQTQPDVGVAYCGIKTDNGERHYPDSDLSGDILERALCFDAFPCCTITLLMRREILLDLLPLAAGDLNLIIELARRTKFDYVDECLACYRKEESRRWVGAKRMSKKKRVMRHQSELYRQYPSIRRSLLADLNEREGRHRLQERLWSAKAISCFLKATYYSEQTRFRCGGQFVASLFGRFGLNAARGVRNIIASNE